MAEVGAQDGEIADDRLGKLEDMPALGSQCVIKERSLPTPAAEYLLPEQSAVLCFYQ
ncbi:hypothetical protein D3C76_1849680 [compost metagenome]